MNGLFFLHDALILFYNCSNCFLGQGREIVKDQGHVIVKGQGHDLGLESQSKYAVKSSFQCKIVSENLMAVSGIE